jgi:hypothetical protein
MIYLSEDQWLDAGALFAKRVLDTMDVAMTEIYGVHTKQEGVALCVATWGAREADLPVLMKALGEQFKKNMAHLGFALKMKDDN